MLEADPLFPDYPNFSWEITGTSRYHFVNLWLNNMLPLLTLHLAGYVSISVRYFGGKIRKNHIFKPILLFCVHCRPWIMFFMWIYIFFIWIRSWICWWYNRFGCTILSGNQENRICGKTNTKELSIQNICFKFCPLTVCINMRNVSVSLSCEWTVSGEGAESLNVLNSARIGF